MRLLTFEIHSAPFFLFRDNWENFFISPCLGERGRANRWSWGIARVGRQDAGGLLARQICRRSHPLDHLLTLNVYCHDIINIDIKVLWQR